MLLVLSLATLRYADEANLSESMKRVARHSIPAAAVLLPAAFFLSVLSPDATEPNALIYLAYVGAVSLAAGLLILGVRLLRDAKRRTGNDLRGAKRAFVNLRLLSRLPFCVLFRRTCGPRRFVPMGSDGL